MISYDYVRYLEVKISFRDLKNWLNSGITIDEAVDKIVEEIGGNYDFISFEDTETGMVCHTIGELESELEKYSIEELER